MKCRNFKINSNQFCDTDWGKKGVSKKAALLKYVFCVGFCTFTFQHHKANSNINFIPFHRLALPNAQHWLRSAAVHEFFNVSVVSFLYNYGNYLTKKQ
jgi:hypothetical protein